ncbi:hypothetical protein ACRAWF_10545 [Streptomyces sp. L7]
MAGSLRTGRALEALATTLPPSADEFWVDLPESTRGPAAGPSRRLGREGDREPRDPIAVSGRDWAGEAYSYVFLLERERRGRGGTGDDAPKGRRGQRASGTTRPRASRCPAACRASRGAHPRLPDLRDPHPHARRIRPRLDPVRQRHGPRGGAIRPPRRP